MARDAHLWHPDLPGVDRFEWPPGWFVERVDETGSTNDDLAERAASSAAVDRTVLVTGHQTAGRGRRDRRWDAPPATNLLASIMFTSVPEDPSELMRRCGIAIIDATRDLGFDATLKWPNDVLVGPAKAAGMLAQRTPTGEVIVGFGINIGWAPPDAARFHGVEPALVLAAMLRAFDALPSDIESIYRDRLATLGQDVRVERHHDHVVGRAVDVDPSGALIVDTGAGRTRVEVGDVIHLRPGPRRP